MITQSEDECVGPGSIPGCLRNISSDFSLTDHVLQTRPEPPWQKMAQIPLNGTTQPVNIEE